MRGGRKGLLLTFSCIFFLGWNLVSTAPGYGDGGFFFNASGLQYADLEISGIGWGGWLGVLFLPVIFHFALLFFSPSFFIQPLRHKYLWQPYHEF